MEFLITLTIKSTLIILLAGLLSLVLQRNSATLRHWIISLTMIGLLGLPLFIKLLPTVQVEMPFIPKQVIPIIESKTAQPVLSEKIVAPKATLTTKITEPATNNNNIIPIHPANKKESDIPMEAKPFSIPTISILTLVGTIWLLGCCFFFIKFLVGLYHIWSITRNSHPFTIPSSLPTSSVKIAHQNVQFLISSTINTPMTWGVFRPVVLLPTAATHWTKSELQAVLVHELSHIQRRDYWVHTLGLLSVCMYWYNPLIWWMKKQQLLEREKACDEAVLRSGVQRQSYAEQLIQITRCLKKQSSMMGENALPMAKVSQIKKRIVAILNFEDSNYRFTPWKQWQWGAFFGGLFPFLAVLSPIGQQVLQEHFPLPPLETVTHYLDTKQLSSTAITDFFTKKEDATTISTPIVNSLNFPSGNSNYPRIGNELILPQSLETLPLSLTDKTVSPSLEINTPNAKSGLMGQWKEGKSEFKIWIYGEVKTLNTAPYFDILSPDGLIFIEEYIEGIFSGKVHQLTIAKAPNDVLQRYNYGKEINLNTAPIIKKGELLKVWSNNKSFLFFNKNMDKWIADKVQKIASSFENKKQQNIIQETSTADQEFRTKVQQKKKFLDILFMSKEEATIQEERKQKRKNLNSASIPFKQISTPTNIDATQILGRQKPVGKNSGSKDYSPVGNKYTTLIKGNKDAVLLKDFNFHLSENTFKNLQFELSLYNVVDGTIQHAIVQQPIPIIVAEGTGWIRKDLSAYNIVSQGDILVVLKNIGFSGSKRGKVLYFSIANDYEQYQPILENFMDGDSKFWEMAFIMNLTAAGKSPSTSAISKDSLPTRYQSQENNTSLQQQIQTRLVNLHQVSDENENFDGYERLKDAIGDAEIVMLGEQSHGEATTFETKIKLIKYLHQEMGFEVLAFESSLYECQRAWSMIEEGHNVKNTLGNSIFLVWSALEELNPLYNYVEKQLDSKRPLRVAGFDHQMPNNIGLEYFVDDLKSYISTYTNTAAYQEEFQELQDFISALRYSKKTKKYKKEKAIATITFLEELYNLIEANQKDDQASFWLQSIKSLQLFISDMKLGTDHREQQMAENLVWLKEQYPNKKIICWGATSHFLYNASSVRTKSKVVQVLAANYYKKTTMMGDYIKEKYGDKVYTIGFTAYEGFAGRKSLDPPPSNSLEFLIGAADADNYFLPLEGLSLEGYLSRPLGNLYMTNDIAQVMDGVIFNRNMRSPYMDWDFFMYLVPENKAIPRKIDKLKKYQQRRRNKNKANK